MPKPAPCFAPIVSLALVVAALAAPETATFGLAYFDRNGPIVSPLQPLDSASAERALSSEAARINPVYIDQLAERQVLWVRELVVKGAPEPAIRSALDGIAAWSRKAAPLRAAAADINSLEALARANPSNVRIRATVARYWVRELELERANIPSDRWDQFRIKPSTGHWLCTGCYAQRGPNETPSEVFPKARAAVDAALAAGPNDPAALYQAALLWLMIREESPHEDGLRTMELARQAAAQGGPASAPARAYVALHDTRVTGLQRRAGEYRGAKAAGSRLVRRGYDIHGQHKPELDVYEPIFRGSTPDEVAEADKLDRQAAALDSQLRAEFDSALRDGRTDAEVFRIFAARPLDRSRPFEPQWRERERILRYAILLDPTDWRLHLLRAANFNALEDQARELSSAHAQAVLRKNRDNDFVYIYDQTAKELNPDPFTAYSFALQAVRRAPANPFAHQRLAKAMQLLIRYRIQDVPVLPGAFPQAVAQMKLTRFATLRHLDHPENWRDAQTRDYAQKLLDWTNRQIAAIPGTPPPE